MGIYQPRRCPGAKVTGPVTGQIPSKVDLCFLRAAEKWANSGAPGSWAEGKWKDSRLLTHKRLEGPGSRATSLAPCS